MWQRRAAGGELAVHSGWLNSSYTSANPGLIFIWQVHYCIKKKKTQQFYVNALSKDMGFVLADRALSSTVWLSHLFTYSRYLLSLRPSVGICTQAGGVWGPVGELGHRQAFLTWNEGREAVGGRWVWKEVEFQRKKIHLYFHWLKFSISFHLWMWGKSP